MRHETVTHELYDETPDSSMRRHMASASPSQCRQWRARRVLIWTLDAHLASYDHEP